MATLIPGLGGLFQVSILLINAVAILSEDRFLARIGWGSTQSDPGFGAVQNNASIKAKVINLINATRTIMRVPLIFVNLMIIVWAITFG